MMMDTRQDITQSYPSLDSITMIAHRTLLEVDSKELVSFEEDRDDTVMSAAIERALDENSATIPKAIMTPSLFPLMELPTELRLKILGHLLISSQENITIDSTKRGACILDDDSEVEHENPSVAILQTCKRINEEGTPILYGRNNFTISLPLEPKHNPHQSSAFFLAPMRWPTIASINTMNFISNTPRIHPNSPVDQDLFGRPCAVFTCTAAHLLSRFTVSDFRYSPQGPDEYVVLSMTNYVSTQVMRAELSAFQKELDFMMRPSEEYLAAMADDPAT